MSVRDLERAILSELRVVAKKNKLKIKDLMEWSTGKIEPHEDEVIHYLPDLKIYCAGWCPRCEGQGVILNGS